MPEQCPRRGKSRRQTKRHYFQTRKSQLEPLEAKRLLDASGLLASAGDSQFSALAQTELSDVQFARAREVVFIDAAVEDHATLTAGIDSSAEIVWLNADSDGVQQIAAALSGRTDIAAIHIVSHGDVAELQLGNAKLTADSMGNEHADELASIRAALSDSADILLYGCDFGQGKAGVDAAEQLAELTGADVAASDDVTGPTALGGDWDFEVTVGNVETGVVVSPQVQQSLSHTLDLLGFSAIISSDGNPQFDSNDNPGNDSGPNNGIVRSHDTVTFNVDFSTDSTGATNPTIKATLPQGMVWSSVPAVGTGANSGIFDSGTGAAGGDMRTIVIHMPDIAGAISTSIPVQARALGEQNGTMVSGIKFTMCADELGDTELESAEMDLTISSAPFMDIQLNKPAFRGVFPHSSSGKDGAVYTYSLGILGRHPERTGSSAIYGSAPIEDPFTFDMDLSTVSPGSELFTWGPTVGAPEADDGITRDYERVAGGTLNAWSHSLTPSGQTGENGLTSVWVPERSTPDSGDATIGGGSPGGVYPITVNGSDTDGPLPSEYSNGSPIPADEGWFASYQVSVWIPLCDIEPGNDGILLDDPGTPENEADDNGALTIIPEVTSFDPDDKWNDQNNYGADVEDPSNNQYEHTVVSNSVGGPIKQLREAGRWRWVETSTYWYAGDGVTSPGHVYEVAIHSGKNNGVVAQPGLIWGDKFDNTATKIVPSVPYAGQANLSNNLWSRAYSAGGPFNGTWNQYGVDYIIEFGTGGVGGAAGWTDWNSMGDATLEDGETSTVWTQDPTDPALGGTPDPVTGVSDAVTKWRVKLLRNLEPGEAVYAMVNMETIGHSTLDLGADPTGDTIADFIAQTVDYRQLNANPDDDWITSEYNALDNLFIVGEGTGSDVFRGDRLRVVEAQARVDKQVIDNGTGGNVLGGATATFLIEGTVTSPGPSSGNPATDVYVTDILPPGLTLVGGTISPTVTNGNPVEYCVICDDTDWTTTFPAPAGVTGVRWYYGDVPLNTALPDMQFDVLVPFDAQNGENFENTAVIETPQDSSEEEWRSSSAGITAVQVGAMSVGKKALFPLVPEDNVLAWEIGIGNVSEDKDFPYVDLVDILPWDQDEDGSDFDGLYTNVNITGLGPGLKVYVTDVAPATLDSQDGNVDGFHDPGITTSAWYVVPGTVGSQWEYELSDVGGAAPFGMSDITAFRVVSDGTVDPQLPAGTSTIFQLELTPLGNEGTPSDIYTNDAAVRTSPTVLAEATRSGPSSIIVVAPDIEIEKETCLDETGVDCDPTNDAHWGESPTFDDTNQATFRLSVENTGTSDLTATVTDNIPTGLTLVPGSASASTGDVTLFDPTWTLTLVAGDTQYMTFDATTTSPSSYTNTASVDAVDQFGQTADDDDDSSVAFESEISVAKQQTGAVRSATNPDHFEVSYEVELANTALFDLANVTLTEDLFGSFGAGYVSVLTPPAISTSTISAGGTAPTVNAAFDGNVGGAGDDQLLNADGLLKPGDSVTLTYTVIVDVTQLANAGSTFNQVEGGGLSGGPGGAPVTDLSDDGDDPTSDNPSHPGDDGAGGTDDPTPLRIPLVNIEKEIVPSPVPAFSGVDGNFEVTYEFTITNDGTTDLDTIGVEEDFAAQFGGAFVGVTQGPTVTSSTATDAPDLNTPYDGGTTDPAVFATAPATTVFEFGGNTTESFVGKQTVLGDLPGFVIDPNQVYELCVDATADDGAGGAPDPASRHYLGFASYDIDGNFISMYNYSKEAAAVDTTLAAPLNPGDLTMTLTDATGWYNGATQHRRTLAWYGYTDSTGVTYPDYDYTRNIRTNAWQPGGVVGNTITLTTPWAGPPLAAGDAVRNSRSGGSYQYVLLSNGHIDQTGGTYTTNIGGGYITNAAGGQTLWRPGAHSIRPLALADFQNHGVQLNLDNFKIMAPNESLMEPGQEVTFQITVEIDPDAPGAIYDGVSGDGDGDLENQATVTAEDPFDGTPVDDNSDDPNDPTDSDNEGDGDADDPTGLYLPNIQLEKTQVGAPVPSSSGSSGNYDVTFDLAITNSGNEDLDNLSLIEDLATQYGGAFVSIVPQGGAPAVVQSSTATDDPEINAAYDGGAADSQIFDNSAPNVNLLEVGQTVVIRIVVEIDPDSTSATYNADGELENQASTAGDGVNSGTTVDDDSDDPTNATDDNNDGDNDPDDPNTLLIPSINLEKQLVGAPVAASSGTSGNFDVTYDFVFTNTGNEDLEGLTLIEDIAAQYGGGFVAIVPQAGVPATIQASTATDDPEINAAYDGGTADSQLFDNSAPNTNLLEVGQSVTIRVIFEVDPDNPTAITTANGDFENQAEVGGTGTESGSPVADPSDDASDSTDNDLNGDNNPDDPNTIRFPAIDLTKIVSPTTPPDKQADGTWDIVFEMEMTNTGSTVLQNPSLMDVINSPSNLGTTWLSTVAVAIDTSMVTAATPPALNATWQTEPTQDMLDGSGTMNPGDVVKVSYTVNIDPDISGSSLSPMVNQAIAEGEDPEDPDNPVSDPSDDTTDASDSDPNGDNNPDDPTLIEIADIGVAKQLNSVTSIGTGKFAAEYVVVVENTGTIDLSNINVTEDLVAEFGNGFDGVINPPAPAIVSSNLSTGAMLPPFNAAWDGGITNALLVNGGGLLKPGDNFTITFTIEIDTILPDGTDTTDPTDFTNTVTATGEGPDGQPAEDDSDDGTNPNSDGGDGSEDTPTSFLVPQIRASKNHGPAVPSADGSGNYTVPITIEVFNTGSVELTNLSLMEDIATQWGNAFVAVANPMFAPGSPFTAASTLPTVNAAWVTGNTTVDTIDSTVPNALAIGESYLFTFDAIVDPDEIDGSSQFNDNQATVSGDGEDYDGSTTTADDDSGHPDATDGGVDNDEPTPLIIPEVILEKEILSQVPASSGTAGNLDVTYQFTYTNSGTVTLVNPTITDDWATQYGAAFVGVVDQDLSNGDVVAPPVSGTNGNVAYAGAATDNMLDGLGQILPGETVTVTVVVEVDPDADPAKLVNGQLVNQADAEGTYDPTPGMPGDEVVVDDPSDDPTDATDNNPDGDGDADDPNVLSIASIELTKDISNVVPATSGVSDNFDVTFDLVVTNTGGETLNNLTLLDDIASQYGGAFVQVVNVVVLPGTATTPPAPNAAYNGTAGSDMLLGAATDALEAGQTFTVQLTVEVDPDNATAVYDGVTGDGSGNLENHATAGGDGEHSGPVEDTSDDTSDATDNDGDPTDPSDTSDDDNEPDDPTGLIIPAIDLEKSAVGSPVTASSGTAGNFDITYEFVLTNTGTESLNSLSLQEDLAAQYGGGFVQLVGVPTITASTAIDDPELNAAYDGGTLDAELFDNAAPNINELRVGESVTVQIVIEVDPDAATAITSNGNLVNQATVTGTGTDSGTIVDDLSDDPNDATDNDPNADNNPDDPNEIRFPVISLTKQVVGTPVPASSGTQDNYDVTYEFVIENDGTTPLQSLTLIEDFATQFGGAFVQLVGTPSITASTGTTDPSLSGTFDGTAANANIFDGTSGLLDVNQTITVQVVVEVDPDNATATYDSVTGDGNGDLENQATTSGEDPADPGVPVDDNSDDPTDATDNDDDADNDPDDPTAIIFPNITLTKSLVGTPVPATSGTTGNFEVTYDLEIINNGNEALNSLSLVEDLATQYGGGFVQIVGVTSITTSTASDDPEFNAAYDGGATDAQLFDNAAPNTNLLDVGSALTVRIVIEIDPDNPTANLVNGGLFNQATVEGTGDETGNVVDDESDDQSDPTNSDPNSDNDPDDPNEIRIPNIELTKEILGTPVPSSSGTSGNYDVTYELEITNTGSTDLTQLSLLEDFATQFGGAFVAIVPQAGAAASIFASTATDDPEINAAYDGGTSDAEIFDNAAPNTNLLPVGESITIHVVAEIDPNNAAAVYDSISGDGNNDLENQATTAGTDPAPGGGTVDDNSDDPTDATNNDDDADNDPDDPTPLIIPEISLTKTLVGSPVPASSGINGNFDLTYDLEISNTGNDPLSAMTLTEDLATQYGGAFFGLVGTPSIVATTASDVPELNAAYDGGTSDAQLFDNAAPNTNLLDINESVTVRIVIEVDPNNPTAVYVNGSLENQATTTGVGQGSGESVDDLSDDPNDSADDDGDPTNPGDDDNNPDDPNNVRFPLISLVKNIAAPPVPASSGAAGNFDVLYQFVITNTGSTPLDSVTLTEDLATHFGGAFVGIVPQSGAQAVIVSTTATDPPGINPAYDGGTADAQIFDGSTSTLDVNQNIVVRLLVEVDPNNAAAVYDSVSSDGNSDLENQATTGGTDSGDPNGPTTVTDESDDWTDSTNVDGDPSDPSNTADDDNDPDDPVSLIIPDITLTKSLVGSPIPASSGINGNFDLTYDLEITNTGNDPLSTVTLTEDLATQYGGAFFGLVGTPSIVATTATDIPELNAAYDGGTSDAQLFDNAAPNTNLLDINESVTVRIVIEVDPNNPAATYVNGSLENQATTTGVGENSGGPVDDASDDPNDFADADGDGDNNPDDPNDVRFPLISLVKNIAAPPVPASSGTAGNFDVLYQFVITNTGSTPLDSVTLTEDLATHFGGAFVSIVPQSGAQAVIVSTTATDPPGVNPAYDGGTSDAQIFDGSPSTLDVNQNIVVRLLVEVDPNNAAAVYDSVSSDGNSDLENQATTGGTDSGDPDGPTTVTDESDDWTDSTNVDGDPSDPSNTADDDNDPDDPVSLIVPDITLTKSLVGAPVPASSGTLGNFELTYDLEITNTGNDPLNSVTLTEDLATQYGGAFVQIVGTPSITVTTATDVPELNAAYDGSASSAQLFDNAAPNTNLLDINESIIVRIVIEIDPNNPAATYVNGTLENQATTTGVGENSGGPVDDLSDDPSDTTDADGDPSTTADDDNNPDDPNNVRFPLISLTKQLASSPVPSASGVAGNFDATYEFVITNEGTTSLDSLTLTEDFATHFGGAFVSIATAPSITASTATVNPTLNVAYNGGASDAAVFDGTSGQIEPGETITVQIVVEIDPDSPTASYDAITGDGNTDLENQASVTGTDSGDPNGPTTVNDDSDDPTDPTNNDGDPSDPTNTADDDGEPDDPVSLIVPDITLNKTLVSSPVPASSGTADNFDATFDLQIINTGNDPLNSVTLTEDLATQYGGAFVQIVGTPTITATTATDNPELNAAFDGGTSDAELFDNNAPNTNLLGIGESVTVQFVVEIDPDAAGAIWVNGTLENQAETSGIGENSGGPVDDLSDDPANPTDDDGDPSDPSDDDNNPDDPTGIRLQNITLEKTLTATPVPASSGTQGNFDATYEFVIENDGATPLHNITLTEDIATQFGGAFVSLVSPPVITASTATTDPTLNGAYDAGATDAELFDGASGYLEPNETITVQITVEIDPDNPGAIYDGITGDGNTDLENQASTSATDPDDPTNTVITDDSDDPTDPTNDDGTRDDATDDDGDPDDPVSLIMPNLTLEKTVVGDPVVASSGTPGNFDVTYEFVLSNTGNDNMANLSLVEDFATQFGGAFIGLVGAPSITTTSATDVPELSTSFDGGTSNAELFDNTGLNTNLLAPGESVTLQLVAEVDLDATGAILVGDALENQATTSGDGLSSGLSASDDSDDTNDTTNLDPDGDNNPDDPTAITFPNDASIGVAKEGGFISGSQAQYTYRLEHFGNTQAVNLTMPDNMDAVFGAGTYTVSAPVLLSGPSSLGVNQNFDGSGDPELLASGSFLSPGDTAEIQIVVTVLSLADPQGNGLGVYENEVTLSGETPYGDPVSDDSTDGEIPSAGGAGTETVIAAAFAEITGTVYVDADGDGDLSPGESGIIGVTITLTGIDATGQPVNLTVITDSNGFYSFPDLLPGDYTITQSHPPQFIDGDDNIGTLGGGTSNDEFTVSIPFGSSGSFENDFGEVGLRPEFISKSLLLASTPDSYWADLDASAGGTLGLWVPFEAQQGGAVNAFLIEAESIDVDLFDEEMNLLNPAAEGNSNGTWVVQEGERYFARLRGADTNFDFSLVFGDDPLPIDLEVSDNVVIAVGTNNDNEIELLLGAQTHLLSIAGFQFEFDATVIDTFHIGAGGDNDYDSIRVVGTGLDDTGSVLGPKGTFASDAYSVTTYTFDTVIFEGGGGEDYTEVYGSLGDDTLQALPQDTTLTTPSQVISMLGFERVDSYGRGGNDYASMYGTAGDDAYYTFDTYEVLRSKSQDMVMRTIGWDRVDAFGRGGDDTAYIYDTQGDDHFYAFADYAVMKSDHLHAVVNGFEHVEAEAKNGGNDTAYFRDVVSADHLFAAASIATVTGGTRNVWARGFEEVELSIEDQSPSLDLRETDFRLKLN